MVEVLAALLLLAGCTRRIPESGIYETRCRTLGVRFEQTAGACVPFSRTGLAVELLGQRCDDDTLASGLRKLQEESGPERVEAVLRGERVPGSSRHRVVVRYASSSPGSCPLAPGAGAASCDDCQVGKVLVAMSPSACASEAIIERVQEAAKDGLRTCKAEELDAARDRVSRVGQFSSVEVLCTRDTDDGLRRVLVNAERADGACGSVSSQPKSGSAPSHQLTCSRGMTCSEPYGDGSRECNCR
jgi:hypothetical protein